MADRQETGRRGQRAAVRHLLHRGYTIKEEHYRSGHAEIDIIVAKEDTLIAVEVKTIQVHGDSTHQDPVQVSAAQARRISHALAQYAYRAGHEGDFRFDMIQVYCYGHDHTEIQHYEEAWWPG